MTLAIATVAFTIKLGALSPEGTSYMILANQAKEEFEKLTNKEVKIVWYAGGVMGDEPEMVRKIRIGQLHGGGFTGYGLGVVEPSVRIFELPGLFKSYEEFFYVQSKLEDEIKKRFEEKGFELITFFPIGFVYIFSDRPIQKLEDFNGVKLWVWSGDPLAAEVAKSLQGYAQLVNLAIPDVLTGLQTGMINAFYNLPYGAAALQWANYIKYMIDYPITLSLGGVVVSKKAMEKLKPEYRAELVKLIRDKFKIASKSLVDENTKSVEEFKKKGIKLLSLPEDSPDLKKFLDIFFKIHEKFKGELYPPELYDKLLKIVNEYRKENK